MKPHPDRLAPTLAARALLPAAAFAGPFLLPRPGSADARIDLKLLAARARAALAAGGTSEAELRLQGLEGPDLWAGTVQDATARGFQVALEEVISLCRSAPAAAAAPAAAGLAGLAVDVATGRELARRKDILVASGGARMRWSRKLGIHFVDRERGLNLEDAIAFEDRSDRGTLDGFVPDPAERPRLYSPRFLQPVRHERGPDRDQLVLAGRLGPRARGFPARLTFEGRRDERALRLTLELENRCQDHRLRIRFVGFPESPPIRNAAALPLEPVSHDRGRFFACTLVRACGQLEVGTEIVAVPSAQCLGTVRHEFTLG